MGTKRVIRQRDVEPGDITGIYYITVCNLPFDASWQALKDFVRVKCDVDHVIVFRTSTSGWVRVKGIENFQKAWRRLNGGSFGGRQIIASDENKTQRIKIKEIVSASAIAADDSLHPASASLSTQSHSPARFPEQPAYPEYPVAGPSADEQQVLMQTAPGSLCHEYGNYNLAQPVGYPYHVPGDHWRVLSPVLEPPGWGYAEGYVPAVPLGLNVGARAWLNFIEPIQVPRPRPFLVTELRKLLVTRLGDKTPVEAVKHWIYKRCNLLVITINSIHVPRNAFKPEIKGYALIEFCTTSAATYALKLLDECTFKGRKVSARMTTEGMARAALWGWPTRRRRFRNRTSKKEVADATPEVQGGFILPKRPGIYASSDVCPHDRDDESDLDSEAEMEDDELEPSMGTTGYRGTRMVRSLSI